MTDPVGLGMGIAASVDRAVVVMFTIYSTHKNNRRNLEQVRKGFDDMKTLSASTLEYLKEAPTALPGRFFKECEANLKRVLTQIGISSTDLQVVVNLHEKSNGPAVRQVLQQIGRTAKIFTTKEQLDAIDKALREMTESFQAMNRILVNAIGNHTEHSETRKALGGLDVSPGVDALALVGNPGSGKSTILNGVFGAAVFRSGINIGDGLTTTVMEQVKNNITLYDTPGLLEAGDENMRENAKELDKLFQKRESIAIAFVANLKNGNLRWEDAVTFRLLFDCFSDLDINDKFGIIFNQAPQELVDRNQKDKTVGEQLVHALTNKWHTKYWCFVPDEPFFTSKENKILRSPELQDLFQKVPVTKHRDYKPKNINTENVDQFTEEETSRVSQLG